MSGGQQKRVNVALELLTKPSLLFLDEPTSGLDPGLDKSVMELMSGLAKDGRTVIIVTHSVANLGVCDRLLVLVPGGRVAFYGPPAEGLRYFGKTDWAEVFQAFDAEPDRDWAGDFQRSPYYAEHVASGLAQQVPEADRQPPGRPPAPRGALAQISTLCRRYLAVIASDRSYLAVLAIMPIVIGAAAAGGPVARGPGRDSRAPTATPQSLLLVLVIGACFIGAANSVRELVKERAIYARERAAGLSSGTYLFSKTHRARGHQRAAGAAAGAAGPGRAADACPRLADQVAAAGGDRPGHRGAVAGLDGAGPAGLLDREHLREGHAAAGACWPSPRSSCPAGVLPLNGKVGLNQLLLDRPARWGFAATASTVKLNVISPPISGLPDPLWDHKPAIWLMDMGLMVVLALVFTIIAWRRLVGLSPGRKRR